MNYEEYMKCLNDPNYLIKRLFLNQKSCLSYDKNHCSDKICQAHIISKKYLNNISENGYVYMPIASSNHKTGLYEIKPIHISRATKATAFCEFHDNKLFHSFEKQEFKGNYDQIYSLSFRAVCREYFQKKCLLTLYNSNDLQVIDQTGYIKSDYFKIQRSHLQRELRDLKSIYSNFHKYTHQGLKYLLIQTEKLPISATGVLFPLFDANGAMIQNEKHKQHGFVYNMISSGTTSYIIVTTNISLNSNIHNDFISSILHLENDQNKLNYLISSFMFCNDNTAFNPDWYNNLDDSFKKCLNQLINLQVGFYGSTCYSDLLDFYTTFNMPIIVSIKT